ncbi:hypothetical protein GGR57DRAFT_461235 [Xylariaceae sp. FL1272]|nr:hypothetical protein GGR57DRAFT_461235 [Xylariaceae sp. FL1272]
MGLSREPSQRGLFRWNSTKPKSSSSRSSKPVISEPQIIHLGGSRVGTAFEELDIPAPDRSIAVPRPPTQWTFESPAPNPPGIGIAVASPDGSRATTPATENSGERPITQWFSTDWKPPGAGGTEKSQSEEQAPVQGPAMRTAYPYASSNTSHEEDIVFSPTTLTADTLSVSSAGESLLASPACYPSSLSPTPTVEMALQWPVQPVQSTDAPEVVVQHSPQFPKRSTSLSKRTAPPKPMTRGAGVGSLFEQKEAQLRRTQSTARPEIKETSLRRTQSNADAHNAPNLAQGRATLSRPSLTRDRPQLTINPLPEPKIEEEEEQEQEEQEEQETAVEKETEDRPEDELEQDSPAPEPLSIPQRPQLFQSQISPPPTAPLPQPPQNAPLLQISSTKLAGHGKMRDSPHRRDESSSSMTSIKDRLSPRSPRQPPDLPELSPTGEKQRMTPKERFWLHRHYKGETNFLKAWGLQIENEEERAEGLNILRELMRGEEEEERESQERRERRSAQHNSGMSSRASTATSASGRDGYSLDVIAEECQTRNRESGVSEDQDIEFWKTSHDSCGSKTSYTSTRRPRPEMHARTESDNSVLGTYLDLRRLSREQ